MEETYTKSASPSAEFLKDPSEQINQLQHEHRAMLRGLQEEIGRLQQQCSSMQQQMVYQGLIPSLEDTLKQKLEDLNDKLTTNSQECDNLRAELCQSKKLVEDLQERVREQDERYQEDVSARNLIVVRLRREVQEKTKAIATLTSLMHPGLDTAQEKAPPCQGGYKHLQFGAETRSLPSVWNPAASPPVASRPFRTGQLYEKILKFQPKSNETFVPQPQFRPCSSAGGKTSENQPVATSTHYRNGNFPSRTFWNPKTVALGMSPEQLRTRCNQPHSLSMETDDNSVLSSSVKGKDIVSKH